MLLNNNVIDNSYKKCIYDFYNTGHMCENEIMTIMREKSFINIILSFIINLFNNNHKINKMDKIRIIITVGLDHVDPLKKILNGITNNIRIII
jgi:hypothetical protein